MNKLSIFAIQNICVFYGTTLNRLANEQKKCNKNTLLLAHRLLSSSNVNLFFTSFAPNGFFKKKVKKSYWLLFTHIEYEFYVYYYKVNNKLAKVCCSGKYNNVILEWEHGKSGLFHSVIKNILAKDFLKHLIANYPIQPTLFS